jgi:hypothetical protein
MALYNNGYQPTYTPNFMKAQAQNGGGGGDILSNPMYRDQMAIGAPVSMPGSFSGGPALNPNMSMNSNSLNVNFDPAMTSAWQDPKSIQVGTNYSPGSTLMNMPLGGLSFGRQAPSASPIMRQLPFANPMQPLVDSMSNIYSQANAPTPGGGPNTYMAPGTPGVAYRPGAYGKNFTSKVSPQSAPNNLYPGGLNNTSPGSGGYVDGSTPVNQAAPWDVQNIFSSMNGQQWGTFANNSNPAEIQGAFSQAAQNYSNAFANPNYQNWLNTGKPANSTPNTQQTYDSWLGQAYDTYVNQMNKYHRF